MIRSALKKSSAVDGCCERRVTFSKTVEIYGNSVKPECVADKSEEKFTNCDPSSDIELFSLKSVLKAIEAEPFDCNVPDDPNDFLVHKVVYDDDEEMDLNDNSDDVKTIETENGELFCHDSDMESEEFVVHQANLSEDEVCNETNELESENCIEHVRKKCKTDEAVCELSVQNIEQHNKLTENQLRLECKAKSSAFPSSENSKPHLSPPLQELSVNRLICPQADNWFWNLDISPLNSVQETDSESNPSSEDTMIMMTSEESIKNEQRIQESLQKFESLKKQGSAAPECETNSVLKDCVVPSSKTVIGTSCTKMETESAGGVSFHFETKLPNENSTAELKVKNLFSDQNKEIPKHAIKDPSTEICDATIFSSSGACKQICEKPLLLPHQEPLNSLLAIQIPKDVREWKICLDKSKTRKRANSSDNEEPRKSVCFKSSFENGPVDAIHLQDNKDEGSKNSRQCSDELEHFVDQCTERVERIRKRYSINENMLWTPRRGIRPRFGSSAEIFQHTPNGSHVIPSSSANNSNNNHYSWPYYVPVDQQEGEQIANPSSSERLPNFLNGFQDKTIQDSDSCTAAYLSINNSNPSRKEALNVHLSVENELASSLPFLSFHERGTPEGASPPRLSSESLHDSENLELPEGMVYYSMQV